jgi:hypothetical protein
MAGVRRSRDRADSSGEIGRFRPPPLGPIALIAGVGRSLFDRRSRVGAFFSDRAPCFQSGFVGKGLPTYELVRGCFPICAAIVR